MQRAKSPTGSASDKHSMVSFEPVEVRDLRESAPAIPQGSMRNMMGNSRSRISENKGLANLISSRAIGGGNMDVDQ